MLGSGCARRRWRAGNVVRGQPAALGIDQLVEPTDLPVRGLQPQLLELGGVGVEAVDGATDGRALALATLLDPPAAALQDPHPRLGGGPGEERQMDAEAVVGPGLR